MLIYNGDKLYFCDTCGKPFNWKGNLKLNMLIQTRHKPHFKHVRNHSQRQCDLKHYVNSLWR